MTHIKVPMDRIGAIIGPKGSVKEFIEKRSASGLDIDSQNGTVEVIAGEDPLGALKATDVIQAIARGFSPEKAFGFFDDDYLMLEVIDLSGVASTQKEMIRLKGRIIGKGGKTREIAEKLIGVRISVYGKTVSIIGHPDQIQIIRTALDMLIEGAVHGSVYSFLEKKKQELMRSRLDSY